jgi:hypothetical protein
LSNIKQTQWLQALPAVGINEQTNATVVMVFPNPAQNQISFTVESSKVAAIQVMDITGRMIDFIVTTGDNVSKACGPNIIIIMGVQVGFSFFGTGCMACFMILTVSCMESSKILGVIVYLITVIAPLCTVVAFGILIVMDASSSKECVDALLEKSFIPSIPIQIYLTWIYNAMYTLLALFLLVIGLMDTFRQKSNKIAPVNYTNV